MSGPVAPPDRNSNVVLARGNVSPFECVVVLVLVCQSKKRTDRMKALTIADQHVPGALSLRLLGAAAGSVVVRERLNLAPPPSLQLALRGSSGCWAGMQLFGSQVRPLYTS